MTKYVLIDTGPLVAMLREDDEHHNLAVSSGSSLAYPFVTSWAVLAEAAWLLRKLPNGLDELLRLVELGMIEPRHIPVGAIRSIRSRFANYRDLRPQLADLTLCWLAKQVSSSVIFTFDRRDFLVYRTKSGNAFAITPE